MKWGQRRYQNEDGSLTSLGKERYGKDGYRSSRGTARDLNKLDREHSNAVARRDDYQSAVTRRKAKEERRAKKRGEPVQYSEKTKKWEAKAKQYADLVKRNESLTQRIIDKTMKKGWSIKEKATLRAVNKGRNAAASILGSAVGVGLGMLSGTYVQTSTMEFAPGTKYRVKRDGLGTRTHDSSRRLAYGSVKQGKRR